jgi:hypothetical protein
MDELVDRRGNRRVVRARDGRRHPDGNEKRDARQVPPEALNHCRTLMDFNDFL